MIALRGFAALLFVGLVGLFIAQPVLRSSEEAKPEPRAAAASATPRPATQKPARSSNVPTKLLNRYPRECLRPVARPEGSGLVAAYNVDGSRRGERVTVATLEGETVVTIRDPAPIVRPPIGWSPSGRYLAVGSQGLFWRTTGKAVLIGDVQHGMVPGLRGTWAWSPIADCGLALVEGTLHAVSLDPGVTAGPSREILDGGVKRFAFTADGRKVVVTVEGPTGLTKVTADLATGRVRPSSRPPARACSTCSPSGDFRVGTRDQRLALLDAGGGFLRFITEIQTPNGVWGESAPEWGPAGTGVLFERHMHLINQLWFIAERAAEPDFVVNLESLASLAGAFDWSATPPIGRPARPASD